MGIRMTEQKSFGKNCEGQETVLYTITNHNGMCASVSDYGANLVSLKVPDKKGNLRDVVLGFDLSKDYSANPSFFGALIGPSANRIANAEFELDGTSYRLERNDGANNLHSHRELGYHKRIWKAETSDCSVIFTLEDTDGSMGFPGNKFFQVIYYLDEDNGLTLSYFARSDKRTLINPTNHAYFNLEGHDGGNIGGHELWLGASHYTPVRAGSIPTGEIASVIGTPMDFTQMTGIGARIDDDFEQLQLTGGYDHNYCIDDWNGELRHFATAKAPESGLVMKAYTTLPGVQFYAGNFIDEQKGRDDVVYKKRQGFCLETQYYPDSINQPAFPSCIFGEDRDYRSVTVYRFDNQ